MPSWTDDEGNCHCETVGARRLDDAAAVAAFGPGLTRADVVDVLAQARYDRPCTFPRNLAARARNLEGRGLLERDPTARHVFRCTTLGEAVLAAYRQRGWLR